MDWGIKDVRLDTEELEDYGDTASEIGKYTLKDVNWMVLDKRKYMVIWKIVYGQREMHRDYF